MVCNKAISEKEWIKLVTLEYILTQGYSNNVDSDTKKYMELSDRKWNYGFAFNSDEYYKNLVSKSWHQ